MDHNFVEVEAKPSTYEPEYHMMRRVVIKMNQAFA